MLAAVAMEGRTEPREGIGILTMRKCCEVWRIRSLVGRRGCSMALPYFVGLGERCRVIDAATNRFEGFVDFAALRRAERVVLMWMRRVACGARGGVATLLVPEMLSLHLQQHQCSKTCNSFPSNS